MALPAVHDREPTPPRGTATSVAAARLRVARIVRALRALVIAAVVVLAVLVYLLAAALAPASITAGGALVAVALGVLAGVLLTRRAVVLAIAWRAAGRWALILPIARLLLGGRRR